MSLKKTCFYQKIWISKYFLHGFQKFSLHDIKILLCWYFKSFFGFQKFSLHRFHSFFFLDFKFFAWFLASFFGFQKSFLHGFQIPSLLGLQKSSCCKSNLDLVDNTPCYQPRHVTIEKIKSLGVLQTGKLIKTWFYLRL